MPLYIDNSQLRQYKNYIVKLSHSKFQCAGILSEATSSLDLGSNILGEGEISNTSLVNKVNDSLDGDRIADWGSNFSNNRFGRVIKGASSIAGFAVDAIKSQGLDKLSSAYTVVKPSGWKNPELSFKLTFFEGLNVGVETPKYSEFVKNLAKVSLPQETAGFFNSGQVEWGTMFSLYALQASSGLAAQAHKKIISSTFKVNIGRYFSAGGGFWLTDSNVTQHNHFDEDGQPIIWEVDFRLRYYKQPSSDEWSSFFI